MQKLCNNAHSSQHDSNISTTMDDNFADYRKFCANRMRRLERYKKAKSFCSLEDETSNAQVQAQAQTSISNGGCSSSSTTTGSTILCEQRLPIDSSRRTIMNPIAQRIDTNAATLTNSQEHHDCSNATQKFDLLREKMVSYFSFHWFLYLFTFTVFHRSFSKNCLLKWNFYFNFNFIRILFEF